MLILKGLRFTKIVQKLIDVEVVRPRDESAWCANKPERHKQKKRQARCRSSNGCLPERDTTRNRDGRQGKTT